MKVTHGKYETSEGQATGQDLRAQYADFLSQTLRDDLTVDSQEPSGVDPIVDFYRRGILGTERGRYLPQVTQHVYDRAGT